MFGAMGSDFAGVGWRDEVSDSVILVGCGKMGGALLGGWLDRGVDAKAVAVVEPAMSDQAGVPSDQVFTLDLCTKGNPKEFFSYRRDGPGVGRMMSVVWML